MNFHSSRFNAFLGRKHSSLDSIIRRAPPQSVFGIIVVGLLTGLVVGLLTGPTSLCRASFSFRGGALVTAGLYFYTSQRSQAAR